MLCRCAVRSYYPRGLSSLAQVEVRVLEMVRQARALDLRVTRNILKNFGKKAASLLATKAATDEQRAMYNSFSASTRWLDSFVTRHKLRGQQLRGEALTGAEAVAASRMAEIRKACGGYDPDCIYNMRETSLFYRLLPKRSYLALGDGRTIRGIEDMAANERVTALICANATGSQKMPLALIGRPPKPACFRLREPPVLYLSQERAWPDNVTVELWWGEFLKFVRNATSKKVLLLVGKHGSHANLVDPEEKVKVMGFPGNRTSVHEPMDRGVTQAWKSKYKTMLLSRRIDTMASVDGSRQQAEDRKMASGTMGLAEGCEPHLLDAAELGHAAWEAVPAKTIARCVQRAASLEGTGRSSYGASS